MHHCLNNGFLRQSDAIMLPAKHCVYCAGSKQYIRSSQQQQHRSHRPCVVSASDTQEQVGMLAVQAAAPVSAALSMEAEAPVALMPQCLVQVPSDQVDTEQHPLGPDGRQVQGRESAAGGQGSIYSCAARYAGCLALIPVCILIALTPCITAYTRTST